MKKIDKNNSKWKRRCRSLMKLFKEMKKQESDVKKWKDVKFK